MAMRRPRIKPVANIQLNSKRKAKSTNDVKIVKAGESDINCMQEDEKQINILRIQTEEDSKSIGNALDVKGDHLVYTTTNENNPKNGIYEKENNYEGAEIVQEVETGTGENINNRNLDPKNIASVNVHLINNTKEHPSKNAYEDVSEAINDSEAFKCPPKVEFQRSISHASNSGIDDVFYSDIEENALQMDLEKSPLSNCPMSPSKNLTRQRIRPTPHFGQRRNSFVGTSPSPHTSNSDDNHSSNFNTINDLTSSIQTRRERNNSASFAGSSSSHHHYGHTPHKYLPTGITNSTMGRIRTESGCSVFSDTNTSTHKSRKTEDNSKSTRRDFEARFHNGVPEKSVIKMSDLIYYNPATNPMEQKPNQNVKSEQTEASSNDVKPFTEKLEKDTDISTESEAAPVPQLKLNAKGELILDDKSLVIETTAEQEARKVLANSSLIYLDENTGMNGFYSRQKRTREWVPSETIKFYRCLQNVGTDFSLMVSLFPNRTRRDLKLKFKKEERKNGHLINKALLYPKQFDIESLKQQIDEEEKLREEQAKMAKKLKEAKKRKINVSSRASRVLLKGDIYQNESNHKPKRIRKSYKNKDGFEDIDQNANESITKANDSIEITHDESMQKLKQKKTKNDSEKINQDEIITSKDTVNNDNITDKQTNEKDNVVKRRRRRTPNKTLKDEIIIIKEEIIKTENKPDSNQTSAQTECQDAKQLQTEIDELLESDEVEMQYAGSLSYEQNISTPPYPVLKTTHFEENFVVNDTDINKNEQKTFINLDDGSVNVYDNIKDDVNDITHPTVDLITSPTQPHSPLPASSPCTEIEHNSLELAKIPERDIIINNDDTCSSVISERELNEDDIQNILTELAEGSLVLVSTLDPDDPDKVLNEIYMVDKNTGNLCDEPLSIPDNIVECILTLVT